MNSEGRRLSPLSTGSDECFAELLKALDTFILTAPLGEYKTRLDMVRSFANQLEFESISLARSLSSLWRFYSQFSQSLEGEIRKFRLPLEKKLAQEVKLAKWDEQTYYMMADSTQRNHQKLMRILREYDEVLEKNSGEVLELIMNQGIRSTSNVGEREGSFDIPMQSAMFPGLAAEQAQTNAKRNQNVRILDTPREFTLIEGRTDCAAANIGKYARKMASIQARLQKDPTFIAEVGYSEASDLSTTILERIESLRLKKSAMPMKERALVDLLKELKQQGYSESKWSTPRQIQRMSAVFLLPALPVQPPDDAFCFVSPSLESSDSYYQRCLWELNRFRGEVAKLGSPHLTQRQMMVMLSYAESGLLMLSQQRCAMWTVLSQRNSLCRMLSEMNHGEKTLPSGQIVLQTLVEEFDGNYLTAIESAQQLLLLLKSSLPLFDAEDSLFSTMQEGATAVETALSKVPTNTRRNESPLS
jgi:midasin (ATPase involved in ribosome maturation)